MQDYIKKYYKNLETVMSIKSFFKDLLQPQITTVIEADYKNLPPEMLEQLMNDSIAITIDILQEKLPTPERLELLADWFDKTTAENPDKEVQRDLRKWAEGLRYMQKLYDNAKRKKKSYPVN